jgi:hypothetical protein
VARRSAFTASLTSSIVNYPVEHGRRYHAYRPGGTEIPGRVLSNLQAANMEAQLTRCQTIRLAEPGFVKIASLLIPRKAEQDRLDMTRFMESAGNCTLLRSTRTNFGRFLISAPEQASVCLSQAFLLLHGLTVSRGLLKWETCSPMQRHATNPSEVSLSWNADAETGSWQ